MTDSFRTLLAEQQIIVPSYTHYGGASGLQDYGVVGLRIKQRFLSLWRQHFISGAVEEIEAPDVVPYAVLKASGHVDKFTDYIVNLDGAEHRADHAAKASLPEGDNPLVVDQWDRAELEQFLQTIHPTVQVQVKEKSLMMGVNDNAYLLRPELAQSIYPSFRRILDYHKGSLPLGIAQVGRSYRNEIAPKPFTRLISFQQAEVEYFYDPSIPSHPDWDAVKQETVSLFSSVMQLAGQKVASQMTLAAALDSKIISDQITATFVGKIQQFMVAAGFKDWRFRQHLPTEMAHYAADCWDLECLVDGEWLECAGLANRQDYDLKGHDRNDQFKLKTGRSTSVRKWLPNTGYLYKTYKREAQALIVHLAGLELETTEFPLTIGELVLTKEAVHTVVEEVPETYYPHVIEPSFGIDRLLYTVLSQNYSTREGAETRIVLGLKPVLAPYDLAVFQLSNDEGLLEYKDRVVKRFVAAGYKVFTDTSGVGIGKRYVRADRIGIPYAVTIDFDSLNQNVVTLRNRDSMEQVLGIPVESVVATYEKVASR